MMNTEILVVSYSGDKDWLVYCLRSIQKFASGFSRACVLVPRDEIEQFFGMLRDDNSMFYLKGYDRVPDKKRWHLDHQLMKCYADQICREADFILHTDSDCIFTEPVTPEDYMINGKPVMLIESFKRIGQSNWKSTTDAALGIDSKWETMRRHPAVHYSRMYRDFRNAVATKHGSFDEYVLSCKSDFPWGFSEFNALGNFVMESPFWKDKYHIIDIGIDPRPKDKLLQFWSHWGLDGKITDAGPNLGKRPRDIIEQILK